MARINQDLSEVKKEDMENSGGGWQALKPGDYRFVITATEWKPTRSREGMCLHIFVQCVEPEHSRSKWREFLTLEHSNPETVRIAKARLKQIAIAVGHPDPDFVEQSEDLHDTTFIAQVIRETADDPKYGDRDGWQNKILAFKPVGAADLRLPSSRKAQRNQSEPPEDDAPPHEDEDSIPF